MRDPYEVLGVAKRASHDELRKAYRQLARRWHPDLHPNEPEAEARFKEVASAWEVLGDPARRARHDGPRDVEGDDIERVAAAVERAEDWLRRGVLPPIAQGFRGHGAEALTRAIADSGSRRPGPLPSVGWWSRRVAERLGREIIVTLDTQRSHRAIHVVRHAKAWEIQFSAPGLLSGVRPADLDDVVMELLVDAALRCLAVGRVVVDPLRPDAPALARRRDDEQWRRVNGKRLLWAIVIGWNVWMLASGVLSG